MSLSDLSRTAGLALAILISAFAPDQVQRSEMAYAPGTGPVDKLSLPAPFATPSARNNSKVVGWPKGKMPTAASGFEGGLFSDKLANTPQPHFFPNSEFL